MKRSWSLVLTAAAAVLAIAPISLAEDASKAVDKAATHVDKAAAKADKAMKPTRGAADLPIYAGLNLTEDQKAKINEKSIAKKAALAEWETKHSARLAELNETAKNSPDKTKVGAARSEIKALNAEKAALDQQYDDAAFGVLTEDQKKAYQGNKVYAGLMGRYAKLKPTDEQKAEIRKRANAAGATLVGKDAAAVKEASAGLQKSIEAEVLTAAQREELSKPKEKAPAEAAPAKPK